jgi:predicted metalloprotease with PDZ domain
VPYDFETVVKTLNGVVAHDWAGFLRQRLSEKAPGAPLGGFTASGYKLIYTDTPTPAFADNMRSAKVTSLAYSGGLAIGPNGAVESVKWDSAAFAAGLTVGDTIVAVNDRPYSEDQIKAEIIAAKVSKAPIRLLVKTADRLRSVEMNWTEGLRYPRFEKTGPDGPLDKLLASR